MKKVFPTLGNDWGIYMPEVKYLSPEPLVTYKDLSLTKYPGVIVGKIVPQEQVQLSLFDKLDREKRKSINKAVDNINILLIIRNDMKW